MSIGPRHTRRQVLGYLFSLCMGLPWRGVAENEPSLLATALVRACREPESARRLGLIYLQNRPHEAHIEFLLECLTAAQTEMLVAEPTSLKAYLLDQGQRDFALDRVVRVDSWILSETEARWCALAAMVTETKQIREGREGTRRVV